MKWNPIPRLLSRWPSLLEAGAREWPASFGRKIRALWMPLRPSCSLKSTSASCRPVDAGKKYREVPRFPSVTRDIALIAPLSLPHGKIVSTLRSAGEPLLAEIELFDVFTDPTGVRVPADRKSIAYSLTYRSADRTLTSDEVSAAHARLKERLRPELSILPRE